MCAQDCFLMFSWYFSLEMTLKGRLLVPLLASSCHARGFFSDFSFFASIAAALWTELQWAIARNQRKEKYPVQAIRVLHSLQ